MGPVVHQLKTRYKAGKAVLVTLISFEYIDEALNILTVLHFLNGDLQAAAEPEHHYRYIAAYGKEMIEKAECDLDIRKEVARRQRDWLGEEMAIAGWPEHLRVEA